MIRGKVTPSIEYLIFQYMNKFKISYKQVMEEPAEAFWMNINIMGILEQERQKEQREQELKAKVNHRGR